MAALNEKRCHIAFMDSRGYELQAKVDTLNDGEYLGIRKHKGAGLHQLTRLASSYLDKYPFDGVYIIGGACDITTKAKNSNQISFEWSQPSDLGKYLALTLASEDQYIEKHHPASRVVFCPLVGVALGRVVNVHPINEDQQAAVDEAVFKFNEEVFIINKRRKVFSPSLYRTVHKSNRGKHKSFYQHLGDGIHLTNDLKEKWAVELVKATKNN